MRTTSVQAPRRRSLNDVLAIGMQHEVAEPEPEPEPEPVYQPPTEWWARFAVEAVEGEYFDFGMHTGGRQTDQKLWIGWLDVRIPQDMEKWNTEVNAEKVLDQLATLVKPYTMNCLYMVDDSTAAPSLVLGTGRLSAVFAHLGGNSPQWESQKQKHEMMSALHQGYWPPRREYFPTLLVGTTNHAGKWRYAEGTEYHVDDSKKESTPPRKHPVRSEYDRFPSFV